MARPLRIVYPGAFYHVTSRGNEKKAIFKSNGDRSKFLEYLQSANDRYNAVIHVYCLMENHYHLLLETPSGNLPQIMRHINGAYTTYFNIKRDRNGHLFQGRYQAILVEQDVYAKELSRYIHLNPVRAGVVGSPEAYPWSSYLFYIGAQKPPAWLHRDFILGYFGENRIVAQKKYKDFVKALAGKAYESPMEAVVGATVLGSDEFISNIKEEFLVDEMPNKDVPALKVLAPRISMQEIFKSVNGIFDSDARLRRNVKMYLCRKYTPEKLLAIGKHFQVGESGVSQACRRMQQRIEQDPALKKKIAKIEERIRLSRVKT